MRRASRGEHHGSGKRDFVAFDDPMPAGMSTLAGSTFLQTAQVLALLQHPANGIQATHQQPRIITFDVIFKINISETSCKDIFIYFDGILKAKKYFVLVL
jgi:hypothetical protein